MPTQQQHRCLDKGIKLTDAPNRMQWARFYERAALGDGHSLRQLVPDAVDPNLVEGEKLQQFRTAGREALRGGAEAEAVQVGARAVPTNP